MAEEKSNLESVEEQYRQRSGLDELEKQNKATAKSKAEPEAEAKAAPKAAAGKTK